MPAVMRPDGQVFVTPYHAQAWEMAYPNLDQILESGKLPTGAQEGFMVRGKFQVRSIQKGPQKP
jgi:hypothetical protein